MTGTGREPVLLAAQRAAGVVAARHRGDLAGAEALLSELGDAAAQARGFLLLAELALTLVRTQTGQSMDDLVRELSLLIAAEDADPAPARRQAGRDGRAGPDDPAGKTGDSPRS